MPFPRYQQRTFGKHPRKTDRFRALLAHYGIFTLLLLFLTLVALIGAGTALGYWLTSKGHSYWFWWRQAFLILSTQPTASGLDVADTSFHAVLQTFLAVMSLTLPALVLGIIVFKAFIAANVITFRRRIALMKKETVGKDTMNELTRLGGHDYCLALRLYSSTPMELVEVSFFLYARVRGKSLSGAPIVTNHKLDVVKGHWPIALTHVPYTLYIPLRQDDVHVHRESGTTRLVALQGHPIGDRCELLLHISGNIPALNSQFFDAHWYEADADIEAEPFGEVSVNYDTRSKRWEGWAKFD